MKTLLCVLMVCFVAGPGITYADTCNGCGDSCACSERVDVAFVIDTTGSTKKNGIRPNIRSFMKAVVQQLDLGQDKVKTMGFPFSSRAKLEYGWTFTDDSSTDHQALCDILDNFPRARGDTHTSKALQVIVDELDAGGFESCGVVVLITDGGSDTKEATIQAAQAIHNHERAPRICHVSVGLMNPQREAEIAVLVGEDGKNIQDSSSPYDPNPLLAETLACICDCPVEPPEPTPPPPPPPPPPSEPPCTCFVRGDPVVVTCSNELVLLGEQSIGEALIADVGYAGCTFQAVTTNEQISADLIIPSAITLWMPDVPPLTLDGTGASISDGAYPEDGFTVSTTGDGFSRVTFDNCGAYVEYKRDGNFVAINVFLPGEIMPSVTGGHCVGSPVAP